MKGSFALSWCILIALGTVSCQEFDVKSNTAYNESQLAALRSTLKVLLNIEPSYDGENHVGKLPKHMKELYEKYSAEKMSAGDTVRSIQPVKDFIPHFKDLLVYNVSSVSKFEKVKSAQLHIFRRRLMPQKGDSRKRLLPPPCRVRLYQLLTTPGPSSSFQPLSTGSTVEVDMREPTETERTKLRSLDTVPVAQMTRGGWYTIEISMALKEMLNSPGATSNLIFGVRFEGPRGKSITPQHFLKEPGVNSSSSYIVVFSEDLSPLQDASQKLTQKEISIMVDLLEKSAHESEAKENKGRNIVDDTYKKNRHGRRKLKKVEINDDEVDAIRHGKKHNNNIMNQKRKLKKSHYREYTPSVGNGDISELVNFENVKRAIALRRHNHKSVNSLNLRYDSNTKSIIQKKAEKSYDDDEEPALNRTRRVRSIKDNSVSDYVIEFVEEEEDKAKKEPNKPENEEYEKENDMGDLSYYEPDVFLDELAIPRSYRHKFHKKNSDDYGKIKASSEISTATDKNDDTILKDDENDFSGSGSYEISSNNENDGMNEWDEMTTETIVETTERSSILEIVDKRRHKNHPGMNRRKTKKNKPAIKNHRENQNCKLLKLDVKFDEISNNIIAPDRISLNICSGKCRKTSPTREDNYSNHALFQNWLNQSGKYHIQEACCVPTKLKSFTVLYLNSENHVILRNYGDALAESCGCR